MRRRVHPREAFAGASRFSCELDKIVILIVTAFYLVKARSRKNVASRCRAAPNQCEEIGFINLAQIAYYLMLSCRPNTTRTLFVLKVQSCARDRMRVGRAHPSALWRPRPLLRRYQTIGGQAFLGHHAEELAGRQARIPAEHFHVAVRGETLPQFPLADSPNGKP